jgi:hypothetical protein
MANEMVLFVVEITINDGQFDQFESVAQPMTAGSRTEPATVPGIHCRDEYRRPAALRPSSRPLIWCCYLRGKAI